MAQKEHIAVEKLTKIGAFDPNGIGAVNGNLFGLPFTAEESEVVIIPVPWEVTVSFRAGTANGPAAILAASPQIDLFDPVVPDAWKMGIAMLPISKAWKKRGKILRGKAQRCIQYLERHGLPTVPGPMLDLWDEVNEGGRRLAEWVKKEALGFLKEEKVVGVLGGDHSVALGLMEALAEVYPAYGVLHIDAHYDLRDAYEGFKYSHASIMRNAREIKKITRFIHVGVRDYCEEEVNVVENSQERHIAFSNRKIRRDLFGGVSLHAMFHQIVEALPPRVYLSLDIDGLNPTLCPNTGTPVPGGLGFEEVGYLIECVVESGREVIGFDLSEVAPDPKSKDWTSDWNAIVGSRVLYRLAILAARSLRKV